MTLLPVAQREAVGVRVRILGVHRFDADLHAQIAQGLRRTGQSLIGGVPAHQPAEKTHVRTLGVVGRREGAVPIKLDQNFIEFAAQWFELRASGTDAVLRYYMEGADPQLVAETNEAFTRLAIPDAGGASG